MTIDELLQERRIQRQKVAAADITALISRAERLTSSRHGTCLPEILPGRSLSRITAFCRFHER